MLYRRLGHAVGFQVVSSAGSIVFTIVTALSLNAGLRGELAAFTTAVLIGSSLAAFGLPSALLFFSAQDRLSREVVVRYRRRILIAIGGVSAGCSVSLVLVTSRAWWLVGPLVVGGVLANVTATSGQWALMGAGRFSTVTKARSVGTIVQTTLCAMILAWVLDGTPLALLLLASSWTLATLATVEVQRRSLRYVPTPSRNLVHFDEFRRYALASYPATLLQTLVSRLDVLLLALVAPLAQVGVYAVALGLADSLIVLPQAVSSVLTPEIARDGAAGLPGAVRALRKWLVAQILMTAAVVTGLALVAEPLLGDGYAGLVPAGSILAIANLALGTSRIMASLLSGLGQPAATVAIPLATLVTMIPGVILAGRSHGAVGAAAASASAYVVGLLAATAVLRRRVRQLNGPISR